MKKNEWKIEIRTTCKTCGAKIQNKRSRTFCSTKCRNKSYNQKYKDEHTDWQRKKRDGEAKKPSDRKKKCAICGLWYVQVGTHIVQVHGITAREYREEFGFPVKKGLTPDWYQQLKGEQALENGTVKNLKKGKKFWYKKNDPRCKEKVGKKSTGKQPESVFY